MHRILIVEDNYETRQVIAITLQTGGYETLEAESVAEARRLIAHKRFDLILLDVNLPDGTGHDICREIRASSGPKANTPVIMLTGGKEFNDKALGFEVGADYYLTKPMQIQELLLWVQSLIRRNEGDWSSSATILASGVSLNSQTRQVVVNDREIRNLTMKEFIILETLMQARPNNVHRRDLIKQVWGSEFQTNTLDVHIKTLRKKLGPAGAAHIITALGVGYRFE